MNQNCSVEYIVTDGNGLQSTSTISFTVVPSSVIANPDGPITLFQGESVFVELIGNDINPEGTGGITITQLDGQSFASGEVFTADGLELLDEGDGVLSVASNGAAPGTYVIPYTIVDADGDTSQSTLTIVIPEPITGNFVLDGGDGSNVSGTIVKDAIANGDPLAITDGNGVATQVRNPVTAANIASAINFISPDLVFDPVTCTWQDPSGNFSTIPVCVETEQVCGLFDNSMANTFNNQNLLQDITGAAPGSLTYSSDVGRPFDVTALITNTSDGSPATISENGQQDAGSDFIWDISAPFAPSSEEAEGCEPAFLDNVFSVTDIDDDQSYVEILNPDDIDSVELLGGLLQDPDNVNPNIYRLPTDGTFAPGSGLTPNASIRISPIVGRSINLRVVSSSLDLLGTRNFVRTSRAASCLSLCGTLISGVDSNGVELTEAELATVVKDVN